MPAEGSTLVPIQFILIFLQWKT